jgi:hypothetical protein
MIDFVFSYRYFCVVPEISTIKGSRVNAVALGIGLTVKEISKNHQGLILFEKKGFY